MRDTIRRIAEFFQDLWFDRTRHVRTGGDVPLSLAGISREEQFDSEHYVPARPAHIRQALRTVPVSDFSEYCYVDLGSGKGRTLFIAAEFNFREIVGVELSATLHHQACRNIRSFGHQQMAIRSACSNARDFAFPDLPLVLYLFNPFGSATMRTVIDNLEASIAEHPRHVVIVLLWPRYGNLALQLPGMQLCHRSHYIQTFSNRPCPLDT